MHVYCILPYRMHCYLHKTKTWESCERKKPNSRQFMRVCVCESECFCFVHFHSKQYLFSSWMGLFMRVCSHCKQREKNCLQNSKKKERKKQMSMLVCITWNPPFSLELFTIRSSCWSACNWIHLSHRRVHSSIYLQMRQENKGRSWDTKWGTPLQAERTLHLENILSHLVTVWHGRTMTSTSTFSSIRFFRGCAVMKTHSLTHTHRQHTTNYSP